VILDSTSKLGQPVLASFLTCAFRPATAALRTLHVSLPTAAAIHLLSVLSATVALIMLVGWAGGESFSAFAFVVDAFADDPKLMFLIVVGVALLIEAVFVWLAFWMMPWGAVDEPLRASFSHTLRRVWCQSPHALLIILLIGGLTAQLDRLDDAWTTDHPVAYPPNPATSANIAPNTPAWTTYFEEVRRIEREARAAKPWYLRFQDAIAVDFGFLCGVWFLGATLRAVGVPRTGPPMPRQPRCDACGYDLTLMPMDSRCPECGEPVAASLGADARPGTPWQRPGNSLLLAWWQTFRKAVRQPTVFGRTLQLQTPGTAHRRFLLLPMPIIFLVGAASPPALYFTIEGHSPFPDDAHLVLMGSPVFGMCCMAGTLMVSLGMASRCGILHNFRDKRNLLSGAVQVVSYLLPFLVLWQIFGAITGIMAIVLSKAPGFQVMCASTWIPPETWAFLTWFFPNLIWGVVYWWLARTAVAATRYANR
jgi:hypothetical protein